MVLLSQLFFSNAEFFFLLVVELTLEEAHRPRAFRAFALDFLPKGHGITAIKYGVILNTIPLIC